MAGAGQKQKSDAMFFPWQAAAMIMILTAGAAVHHRPEVLEPMRSLLQLAAAHLGTDLLCAVCHLF